jgi:SPP1 family predicted phage head-tail adaptor
MNPGLLNKRVTILKQDDSSNSYGEIENIWIDVVTIWGNVRTLTGRALFQANQVHTETTSKVIIRYRKDIGANMRIRFGERILEIIAPPINMNEENRYLELSCKEVI